MKKRNLTVRFGIYMFLSMAVLFFAMKLVGLEKITELRLLNVLIAAFFSNRLAQVNLIEDSDIDYVSNFGSLFFANLIAVVLSCVGLIFYVNVIDSGFMESLGNGFFLGKNLDINKIAVAVLLEGSAASIIVSFSIMQYWKNVKRKTRKIV